MRSVARHWIVLGALSAAVGVATGAFGAHGLRAVLEPSMLAVWETASRYQLIHALALIAVGLIAPHSSAPALRWSGWLFALGTLCFCGSLYALSLTGVRMLGAVAPIGGAAFIAGWVCLAVAGLSAPRTRAEAMRAEAQRGSGISD